jgi:hypothetical protein
MRGGCACTNLGKWTPRGFVFIGESRQDLNEESMHLPARSLDQNALSKAHPPASFDDRPTQKRVKHACCQRGNHHDLNALYGNPEQSISGGRIWVCHCTYDQRQLISIPYSSIRQFFFN